jgi:hypothetical protein
MQILQNLLTQHSILPQGYTDLGEFKTHADPIWNHYSEVMHLTSISPGYAWWDGHSVLRRKVQSHEGKRWKTAGGGEDWRSEGVMMTLFIILCCRLWVVWTGVLWWGFSPGRNWISKLSLSLRSAWGWVSHDFTPHRTNHTNPLPWKFISQPILIPSSLNLKDQLSRHAKVRES